jgi:hypothetical protein
MKAPMRKRIIFLVASLGLLLLGGTALALSSPSVDWWVFGGGGGPSSGGEASLNFTIGQPITGPSSGGEFDLQAGYWAGGSEAEPAYPVYLPLVVR